MRPGKNCAQALLGITSAFDHGTLCPRVATSISRLFPETPRLPSEVQRQSTVSPLLPGVGSCCGPLNWRRMMGLKTWLREYSALL